MYKPLAQSITHNDEADADSDGECISSPEQPLVASNSSGFMSGGKSTSQDSMDLIRGAEEESESFGRTLSLARKFCLAFSIFMCLAFTAIFLWALPCDYDTCRSTTRNADGQWQLRFVGKGSLLMSITDSSPQSFETLVVSTFERPSNASSSKTRLQPIKGFQVGNGLELWSQNLSFSFKNINCQLIDANGDRCFDCILDSTDRGLVALNPKNGKLLWQLHSHREIPAGIHTMNVEDIQPIADVDGDSTADLAALATDPKQSLLLIISGRSGELLWQQPFHRDCTQKLISRLMISQESVGHQPCLNRSAIPEPIKKSLNQLSKVEFQISVQMEGFCPDNCTSTLIITEPVAGSIHSNTTFSKSIIGTPVIVANKATKKLLTVAFNIETYSQPEVNGRWILESGLQIVDVDLDSNLWLTRYQQKTGGPVDFVVKSGEVDYVVTAVANRSDADETVFYLKKTHF